MIFNINLLVFIFIWISVIQNVSLSPQSEHNLPYDSLWPSECSTSNVTACCPTVSTGYLVGRLPFAGQCGEEESRGICDYYPFSNGNRPISLPFEYYCRCAEQFSGEACDRCALEYYGPNCNLKRNTTGLPVRYSYGEVSPKHAIQFANCVIKLKEIDCVNTTICDQKPYLSVYDYFIMLHAAAIIYDDINYAHEASAFGSWHRVLTAKFEQAMRIICNNEELSLLTWDWLNGDYALTNALVTFAGGNGTSIELFQTGDPISNYNYAPEISPMYPFGNFTQISHLGDVLNQRITRSIGTWPELSGERQFDGILFLALLQNAVDWDFYPYNMSSPLLKSGRQVIEGFFLDIMPRMRSSHNYWHLWIGGTMAYVKVSNNDPIWYMHHSMVDKAMSLWQNLHPNSTYPSGDDDRMPVGHRGNDFMVPFIPPITPIQGFSQFQSYSYSYSNHRYHVDLISAFKELQSSYPNILRFFTISGGSVQSRSMWVARLSQAGFLANSKVPRVVITTGIHSNDLIAKEAAYLIAQGIAMQTLNTKFDVDIIIDGNPDGTHIVWMQNETQRKNVNGVDIGRNFPVGFDLECSGSSSPDARDYKGPYSASEPETRSILSYLSESRPSIHIDFQSPGRIVRIPYGSCSPLPEPIENLFLNLTSYVIEETEGYSAGNSCCMGNAISQTHFEFGSYSILVELGDDPQPNAGTAITEIDSFLPSLQRILLLDVPIKMTVLDAVTNVAIPGATVNFPKLGYELGEKWSVDIDGVGYFWVPAGDIVIEISATGYHSKSFSFVVEDGKENQVFAILNTRNSNEHSFDVGDFFIGVAVSVAVAFIGYVVNKIRKKDQRTN